MNNDDHSDHSGPAPITRDHPRVEEVLTTLRAHQDRLSLPNQRFAQHHLGGMAESTWSRLLKGEYGARDYSSILERLEAALRRLDDDEAARMASTRGRRLQLSHVRTVLRAVQQARHEERDRLVVFLGPTGAGKTVLAEWVANYYSGLAVRVEATEVWRDSYFAAVLGVATALGMSPDGGGIGARSRKLPRNARGAEAALLAHVRETPSILVVDEAHYCGPQALNLLKALLNASPGTVVVMLAIPELWARMNNEAYAEAEQLRNRCAVVSRVAEIAPEDMEVFLRDRLDGWAQVSQLHPELARQIARHASQWGRWAEAERVAAAIRLEAAGARLTVDLVRAGLQVRLATQGLASVIR